MAGALIKIAAARASCARRPALPPPDGLYDEFAARFPYEETEDQQARDRRGDRRPWRRAADGPADLRRRRLRQDRGRAARRLRRRRWPASRSPSSCRRRCSRASITRPSQERFRGLPIEIAQASRFVSAAETEEGQGGHRRRHDRHRRRHARAARQGDRRSSDLGLLDRRRGAAFRRRAQGAAEGAARRRPRADAVGDADPAHAAAGADRRARAVADHDAAGRPAGGAHLRLALRSAGHPRGAAARALPRRPELLCRAADRGPRRGQGPSSSARCRRRRSRSPTGRWRRASSRT